MISLSVYLFKWKQLHYLLAHHISVRACALSFDQSYISVYSIVYAMFSRLVVGKFEPTQIKVKDTLIDKGKHCK